jgi:hypothetical protein
MQEGDDLWQERRYGPWEDRVAYATLLRAAAGASAGDWVFARGQRERDDIHLRGLLALVWATGCRLFAYFDMPPFSPARAEVLLAGAERLGVSTDWKGWA